MKEHLSPVVRERQAWYSSSFNSRDMRLMEVPSDVLSHITEGHDLKLIGPGKGGDTVLCTGNKTYSIKKVESSNVSFLVPPSLSTAGEYSLEGSVKYFYEVRPIGEGRIS